MKRPLLAFLSASLIALAAPAPQAFAADAATAQPARAAVSVEVKIILATAAGAAPDTALAANAAQLAKQFPQFKGFKLLSGSKQTLQSGQPVNFTLPIPDAKLGLTLLGAEGGKYKLRMAMPGGSADTTSPDQGVFYVGGMPYNGGTLILAIKTVAVR